MQQARNPNNHLEILGHRGAKGSTPENTLASFQSAIDAGVDMIELDVHLSKDNEMVVIHDPQLEHTTNGRGMVSDYTLSELKLLNAGAKFSGSGDFGFLHLPTLQEVYTLVGQQAGINIEIKTRADGSRYAGIEERIITLIQQNDAAATTVVSSFNFPSVKTILALEPDLACYVILSGTYFNQLAAAGKGNPDVVIDLAQNGFQQVAVNKQYLDEELVSLLKHAGFKVGAWVINEVDEMLKYAQMGVDRITTDYPHQLVPFNPTS